MATGQDQAVGWGLVLLSSLIFLYYTIWVIVLPFVDSEQLIHKFFPERFYAVAVPLAAGVVGLVVIGTFVAVTLLKSKVKEKKS